MGNTSDCIIIQTAAKRHRFTRAWQTAAVDASEGFRTALIAMMPHPEAQPKAHSRAFHCGTTQRLAGSDARSLKPLGLRRRLLGDQPRAAAKRQIGQIQATMTDTRLRMLARNMTDVAIPHSHLAGAPPKSLIRMLGPNGNPQAKNLFGVLGYLQKRAGVKLPVAGQ